MLVQLMNLSARVVSATDTERDWLKSFLSFSDESKRFFRAGGKIRRRAESKSSLYSLVTDSFPAGLLSMVRRAAVDEGLVVDIVDKRTRPALTPMPADTLGWLHDYQRDGVAKCLQRTRGILWLPTGSGKTEIAVGLALVVQHRWLFLVNEADLMHNAARRFEKRTGESAGRIGDSEFSIERFTAATFQSIASALKEPKYNASDRVREKHRAVTQLMLDVEGMIVDEVHTLPADSFYNVAASAPNAYYRIGMSGTPLARGDKRSLYSIAATGELIFQIKPEALMLAGHISRPTIRMVPVVQVGAAKTYQGAYSELIVRSTKRTNAVVELAKRVAKPGLVFVKEIKHGQRLTKKLRDAGLRVEFVWGNTSTGQRDDAIRRLRWGDLDVIVCSVVFQTGTDIPELRGIVIACGGKSAIAALQRIGRGMRATETKSEFEVFDVLDRDGRDEHGRPSATKWMAAHSKARQKAYVGEGYSVRVMDELAGQIALRDS